MKNLTLLFGIFTLVLTGCSSGNNSEQNEQDQITDSDSLNRTMSNALEEESSYEILSTRYEQRQNLWPINQSCFQKVSLNGYHAIFSPVEQIPAGGSGNSLIYLNLPANVSYDTCMVNNVVKPANGDRITEIRILTKSNPSIQSSHIEKFEIKILDTDFNPSQFIMVTVCKPSIDPSSEPNGEPVEKTEYYVQHNTPQIQNVGNSNTVGMQQLNADIITQNCHNGAFSDYLILVDMPEESSYNSSLNSAKGQIALGLPDGTDLKELVTTVRTLDNGDQCLTFDLKVETGLQTTGNRMLIFEREVTKNVFDQIEAYAVQVFELSDSNPKKKKVLKSKVQYDPTKIDDQLNE